MYDAPQAAGVYALWRYGQVIYYGCAAGAERTIRACLVEHLAGFAGRATRSASHFSWERCADPRGRLAQLLTRHASRYGGFPACNREPEAA